MAAINEKEKLLEQQQAAGAVAQTTKQATPYTGLSGLSENTQNILGQYGAGYTPSQTVTQAQEYLNSIVSGKPGAYQSNYKQQLDNLYSRVMNRPKFSYDAANDPMYKMYRDQYMNLGNQAMMDTTAQAAALTGGYGNSYAATAGNQAYQAYLQQLNNVVPDLYQMAMNRYQIEGDDLNAKYAMAADLENQDYGRYQDDYNKWLTERDFAQSDYWNKYNADYGQYGDTLSYYQQLAAQENAQYNANRELAYNQAMAILSTGKTPSNDLLAAAGISKADAKKLAEANKRSSGGGGSKSSSSGSGGNSNGQSLELSKAASRAYDYILSDKKISNLMNGSANDRLNAHGLIVEEVNLYKNQGIISANDAKNILTMLGY